MLHLGARTFDELSGEIVQNVSFVLLKQLRETYHSTYYRLVDGNNCEEKHIMFLNSGSGDSSIITSGFEQAEFGNLPSNTISYWVSKNVIKAFADSKLLDSATPTQGFATGDNPRFIRQWHEIPFDKFCDSVNSYTEAYRSGYKWFPTTKGGEFRRWYGNKDYVIAFDEANYEALSKMGNHLPSRDTYFKLGAAWTIITSGNISFRRSEHSTFEHCGSMCFAKPGTNFDFLISYLNSNTAQYFLNAVSPTLSYREGVLKNIPFVNEPTRIIIDLSQASQRLSKEDWDAHETSWDFKDNELVRILKSDLIPHLSINGEKQPNSEELSFVLDQYKLVWADKFNQLHANEEELNRQFIEIYGLQDELTPEVPLDEITILQQGEISIDNNQIVWHDDVIIKQLLSYAIGCWMGRYRLDKEGLNIAHYPAPEEICTYDYNGDKFEIDDDAIIPLMGKDTPFEDDNALQKIVNFVKMVFGEDKLTENLNFIEHCLGKSIEDYLIKDFWKDHKKMYQNRPIYWLFSSKKGAFQVLVYMHRMNPYTAEKVRTKYLLPYIEHLKGKIEIDEARGFDLTSVERKNLVKMQAALEECLEYHDRLHEIAIQNIGFDLDDGVVVNYAKFGDVLAIIK